ncbi:S-layer homology domain-containing protein [Leucobacter luti]|nr:S-layer homology domain-containing protein [Leucobacter luti]QYM76385.1 S-layer homology domain-containing protein [Leucobacter luti]
MFWGNHGGSPVTAEIGIDEHGRAGSLRFTRAGRRIAAIAIALTLAATSLVAGVAAPALAADGTGVLKGTIAVPAGTDLTKVNIAVTPRIHTGAVYTDFGLDPNGAYEVTGLPDAEFIVSAFVYTGQGYPNPNVHEQLLLPTPTTAGVTIAGGETKVQNFTMKPATAKISGHITLDGSSAVQVILKQKVGSEWISMNSAWSGSGAAPIDFATYGLAAGTYKAVFVALAGDYPYERQQWWEGTGVEEQATPITLAEGEIRTGVDTVFLRQFTSGPTVTVQGTPAVGSTLSAATTSWVPAATKVTYQWYQGDPNGPGAVEIAGATAASYVPTAADVGKRLYVIAVGTRQGYSDWGAPSEATAAVTTAALTATPKPTVTGTPKVGATLTANAGTWAPAPVALSYQWQRAGAPISGATQATYTPVAADAGKTLTVAVTGTKSGYSPNTQTSAATAAIAPATPAVLPFIDVKQGDKFYTEIAWMYETGLSTGIATQEGLVYQPKAAVSREAMAAFLYRSSKATYQGPAVSPFADIKPGDKFYNEITWMAHEGISTGITQPSGKPKYAPKAPVSREAMAAFIYRLEPRSYTAPIASPFADVEPGDNFYREIAWMYDTKVSTGVEQPSGKPKYAPKTAVSREAMAAFLYRVK